MNRISGWWRKLQRALTNGVEKNNVLGDFMSSFVMWQNSTNLVSYLEFVQLLTQSKWFCVVCKISISIVRIIDICFQMRVYGSVKKTQLDILKTYECLHFSHPPIEKTVLPSLRPDMVCAFVMRAFTYVAKSAYYLRHVCQSVCPHVSALLSLDGFSWCLILETFY